MNVDADKIEFCDPPPRATRKYWRASLSVANALRQRPGVWAIIARKTDPSLASMAARNIRFGAMKAFPRGEFEVTWNTVDGEHRVYARYVGQPQAAEATP